jgi:hypothetical protein
VTGAPFQCKLSGTAAPHSGHVDVSSPNSK